MNNISKVIDILYRAYEEKYTGKRVKVEGFSESYKKLCTMLNREQREALQEYEGFDVELLIESQKQVIQIMLELMCPEY